jgi:hypothetical protein
MIATEDYIIDSPIDDKTVDQLGIVSDSLSQMNTKDALLAANIDPNNHQNFVTLAQFQKVVERTRSKVSDNWLTSASGILGATLKTRDPAIESEANTLAAAITRKIDSFNNASTNADKARYAGEINKIWATAFRKRFPNSFIPGLMAHTYAKLMQNVKVTGRALQAAVPVEIDSDPALGLPTVDQRP